MEVNKSIFHVAFAITENETDNNWFLATLSEVIYGEDNYRKIITFVLDRSKGLINAIVRVFPSSLHGYYLRDLEVNYMEVNAKLSKTLHEQCWAIVVKTAYAYTSKEFDDVITKIYEMYSNVAESFNTWIKEGHHLLVTSLVNSIRRDTHLYSEIHNKVELIIEDSRFLRVGRSTPDTYEIVDNDNNTISLRNQKCSCKKWEVCGLPYKHAFAVIMQTDINVYRYIAGYFRVEWYHHAYIEPIP
ncbi:uncharacterized protein LOC120282796 [Dioscorea cayenensis subsp. rotundata]|uniref:Uncharacterized protein LOC120282796 n=1 Tax=Dioscorea cayennensis subsp. rotundata TaxID=55577 RepID=A0AB40D3B4_DIOCR|nr:uncharacterized protein LOC120282796 [Dioscorea cayenensis subsp. rotundata]